MPQTHAIITGKKDGYILLISVLIIGAIASTILASLVLLGMNAGQLSLSTEQGNKSLELAQACAEVALLSLRTSPAYAGNEQLTYASDTCDILIVGGAGNTNRILCTEGESGESIRRLEIVISQILPQTKILSWQEVPVFSLCE